MAVPKQRQSHSRTNKRRSQHKIARAAPGALPALPRRRGCRTACARVCGFYKGREVVSPRLASHDHDHELAAPRVDRARRERGGRRARRSPKARAAPACPCASSGRRRELGVAGLDVVDAPDVDRATTRSRVRAVRSKEDASIVQAAHAVAGGRGRRLVSAGSTGAALAASPSSTSSASSGVHRPAVAVLLPVPGRPTLLLDAGANVEVAPRAPRPVRLHGRRVHGSGARRRAAAVGLLSNGEEPRRAPRTSRPRTSAWRRGTGLLNFVGNVEGSDLTGGAARRRRHRRLHRQRRAQGDRGDGEDRRRRDPRRDQVVAGVDASAAC